MTEFPHPPIPEAPPVFDPVQSITVEEVVEALRHVKPGKTIEPYELAAEV